MKKMKSLVLILVLALSAWTLTGCGGMSEDEAKEYAQAVLDASYKGEFDSYMELTDSTEEEAREMYEGNMDATMAGSRLRGDGGLPGDAGGLPAALP